jgi:RNA polymerase primary sigma factor
MKKPAKFQIHSEEKVQPTAEKLAASKTVDPASAHSHPLGHAKTGKAAAPASVAKKTPAGTQAGKTAKLEESKVVVKKVAGAAPRSGTKPLSKTDAKSTPAQLKAPVTTKKTESKTVIKPSKIEAKPEAVGLKQDVKNVVGPVVKSTTDAATLKHPYPPPEPDARSASGSFDVPVPSELQRWRRSIPRVIYFRASRCRGVGAASRKNFSRKTMRLLH